MTRLFRLLLLLLIVFSASTLSAQDDDTATNIPTSFTMSDIDSDVIDEITFDLPEGWFAEITSSDTVTTFNIANSTQLLAQADNSPDLSPDDIFISTLLIFGDVQEALELNEESSVTDVIALYVNRAVDDQTRELFEADVESGKTEETNFNAVQAAFYTVAPAEDEEETVTIVGVRIADGYLLMIAHYRSDFSAELQTLVNSIRTNPSLMDTDVTDLTDIALTQMIEAELSDLGSAVTVYYPENWVALEIPSSLYLADTQATLENVLTNLGNVHEFSDDALFVTVVAFGPNIIGTLMDVKQATPMRVLVATLLNNDPEQAISLETLTINNHPAATGIIISETDTESARVFAIVLQIDEGFVIMGAITAINQTDFDDTVRAIAASVQATFTSLNNEG